MQLFAANLRGSSELPRSLWTVSRSLCGAAVLVLGAISTSGCESLVREIQAPEVELVGLQFKGVELSRQSFQVSLDVTNPNSIPLPISAFTYQIALAGGAFADGASAEGFTLPANGMERVRIDVSTDLLGALSRITSVLQGSASAMDYEISGDLEVGLPLIKPIPYRQVGEVALKMQ